MRTVSLFAALVPQHIFSNPSETPSDFRIPTVHESAIQARRILHLESIGTLSTVFPDGSSSLLPSENRPSGLGGSPIGLMDYFADCEPATGNPTILAISIATSFKNVAAGSNITLSLRWHPPSLAHAFSAANLPRYSLIGHLESIDPAVVEKEGLTSCWLKYHSDSVAWLPGNRIHESHWVRLVVDEVYWIGGFGDRAYIGWIPVEEWRNVTREEVEECRLPGEKKAWDWKTWIN
ncbi:hypothetical protein LTR66_004111 [Elasticomyces elasticus]|nr:hypothetical protein LTR66_004111 [Elasticomyces elasticus]